MGDDFIQQFQLERKNENKILKKTFFFHLWIIFGFAYYLITNELLGLYLGFGFLIITIPQIFLHIQYKMIDRDKTIIVNHSKKTIKILKKGIIEKEFQFSDINKLIRSKGQKNEDNMTYALPTFLYNYTEIILKNGERICYTDFIAKNIGLKNIETVERISLLNYIG
ncbi:MAG: hypothetical protein K0M40_04610 [Prolixibacteraceae bacterium]|nr:hypothetical protein [Prolixibacteraceae bacterium]